MYLFVFVTFFLVSTATCHLRSINGNLAATYSFPYVVPIQSRLFGTIDTLCTGSIIDKYWILTSAQCIRGTPHRLQIQAGTTSLGQNRGIIHNVSGVFVHPEYYLDRTHVANDVALIKLLEPLVFNENISSIELGILQSKDVIAIGWGQTTLEEPFSKNDLNFILLEVVGIEKCTLGHIQSGKEVDNRTHICTYGGIERAPCFDDLGGPLVDVTTSRLVGIFSDWESCLDMLPAIYMKISEFIDWINSVTNLNLSLD